MDKWKEEFEKLKKESLGSLEKETQDTHTTQNHKASTVENKNTEKLSTQSTFGLKEKTGFAGIGLIIIGVFLPFFKAPVIGSMNYFKNGDGDGAILLVLALGSLTFILIKSMRWLWFTGSGSALTLFLSIRQFKLSIADIKNENDITLVGNPFKGLADNMLQSVELQVGVPVLSIGIALILLSAYLNSQEESQL